MAGVSTKNNIVSSIDSDRRYFDLDDVMMMPEQLDATLRTVTRLVSDMPTVNQPASSCSICMESFWPSDVGSNDSRQVSCGHVYHRDCITDWLLNGNSYSCPLCRHQIFR